MIPTLYPPQLLQAQIAAIPKPGKDHSSCENYRPISLLNTKLKLLLKVIENRVAPLRPSLIHSDQVGFIPGRETRDNITKMLHLIFYTHKKHIPTRLLACDAEKAFETSQLVLPPVIPLTGWSVRKNDSIHGILTYTAHCKVSLYIWMTCYTLHNHILVFPPSYTSSRDLVPLVTLN